MTASLLLTALAAAVAPPPAAVVRVDPAAITLHGPANLYTLLVTTTRGGEAIDRTRAARYESKHPGVARVSARGVVEAVGDGDTAIRVRVAGRTIEVPVRVRGTKQARAMHFINDIEPLFSRHHCNSSGCHGKAEGQNGFKLSVFAFDPEADYAALVKEGRGRRVVPAAPERSLLLLKMSGQMAHGGGARIRAGTRDYETIRAWVAAGLPVGAADAPTVRSVRVEPRQATLSVRGSQQLRVVARYSDGREADVTAHARFQSNNEGLASVDADGLVTAGEVPGDAAILASFGNAQATFRALVPNRQRIEPWPALPESNFIDRLVHAKLRQLHVLPSELCDDATFLRRASLDITGTLPTTAEARRFLADQAKDKRARLVEALLERPEYADYWAMKWADLLRVDRAALGAKQARAYHRWIREQFAGNVPLDRFARAIVTAEGPLDEVPAAAFYKATKKPGEMASSLAQTFLGVRIGCAECHHHPFDRWGQDDYHALTAFFTNVRLGGTRGVEALTVEGLAATRQPRSGRMIFAHALGETKPAKVDPGDRRGRLADWLTARDNPYFARNLANRTWAHLLGRGLIEPVDDVRATNPPSNPELLDALAKHLIENKYDLKTLIRTITASRAYQRSAAPNASNRRDAASYSRALLKRLPAEVLLDGIAQTTGVGERFAGAAPGTRAVQLWDNKVPHYFLKAFGRPERAGVCDCERNAEPSVAQVLHLMNAPQIERKLAHAGGTVAKLVRREKDDGKLVEELYLMFFSRLPSAAELRLATTHLNENAARRREAVEDLAWGMLNALEFVFNH